MVAQNTLRACKRKRVFFSKESKIIRQMKLDITLHTCAAYSELPSMISTMTTDDFSNVLVGVEHLFFVLLSDTH